MLHRPASDDAFDLKLQLSQLRYVTTSRAAATSLAENYVGVEQRLTRGDMSIGSPRGVAA